MSFLKLPPEIAAIACRGTEHGQLESAHQRAFANFQFRGARDCHKDVIAVLIDEDKNVLRSATFL